MYSILLTALAIFSGVCAADVNQVINIVGGDTVKIEDFSYQVVQILQEKIWCGGSIVTSQHVLTAAHCIILAEDVVTIRAGSSIWSEGGSLHDVASNATFSNLKYNDVGIIRVVQSFVFDATRQPIPIATPDTPLPAGALAYVSGWGTDEHGNFPAELKAVQVPLVDKQTCSKDYGGSRFGTIVDGEICAGVARKDSCQGDSGGPLVLNGIQIGVTSMGNGCGIPDYPGIYADVGYFSEWINKQISA